MSGRTDGRTHIHTHHPPDPYPTQPQPPESTNDQPTPQIIGIFAQPSHAAHPACGGACEYIAASYVKWVESAGGRCVPIPYNASVPALETLFGRINGLLLPGGGNPLPDAARYMIGRALKANDAGDYFPVWGTCLGMEWLLQALAGDGFALDTALDAWNISLPLEFTSDAAEVNFHNEKLGRVWLVGIGIIGV